MLNMLFSSQKAFYTSALALIASLLVYLFVYTKLPTPQPQPIDIPVEQESTMPATITKSITSRLRPIYFVSHGGPTFIYRDDSYSDVGAWDTINSLGQEILNDPPKALVVVSAHWQEESSSSSGLSTGNSYSTVGITSTDGPNHLIYDFYGFPNHMYEEQFHTVGSKEIARSISQVLGKPQELPDGTSYPGFNTKLYGSRGFDHGLWVPLRVAFPKSGEKVPKSEKVPAEKNIPFPVIQVSLPSTPSGFTSHRPSDVDHDTKASYALGQALRELRDRQGNDITIVCSGMSVHNLREVFSSTGPQPYAFSFDKDLKTVVEDTRSKEDSLSRITNLFKQPLARKAHPTLEHIMPIAVALGADTKWIPKDATFEEKPATESSEYDGTVIIPEDFAPKRIYSNVQLSLAWGIYKFGRL